MSDQTKLARRQTEQDGPVYAAPALEKGLDILELLCHSEVPLSQKELAQRLGSSQQVRDCVATQWFRFGYGRVETEADTCSMDEIRGAFAAADYDIKELIIALTQTDAFRYRPAVRSNEDSHD